MMKPTIAIHDRCIGHGINRVIDRACGPDPATTDIAQYNHI